MKTGAMKQQPRKARMVSIPPAAGLPDPRTSPPCPHSVHFSRAAREFLWLKLLSVWLFVMAAVANGCKLILTKEPIIKMKT